MEDSRTAGDYNINNDDIVYWVQHEGEGSEKWEEVNIQKMEPAKQEDTTEEKS